MFIDLTMFFLFQRRLTNVEWNITTHTYLYKHSGAKLDILVTLPMLIANAVRVSTFPTLRPFGISYFLVVLKLDSKITLPTNRT